jgi:integrase
MRDGGISRCFERDVPSALRRMVRAAANRKPRKPHLRNVIRIIAETGLRVKKELLPMKKNQIYFLNGVLWIPDSKTPNGIAEIPLPKVALEAFQNQVAIAGNWEFLFPNDRNPEGHLKHARTAGGKL